MQRTVSDLSPLARDFLSEYHLASLATTRTDGTPHVCAVGFTVDYDGGVARVITFEGSQKVLNAERSGYAALTHVDGPRWLTLEGPARIARDPASVRDAEERYATRYRRPKPNPRRVVLEVTITRLMGSGVMFADQPSS
ncbi:PPOX class F420-dependent oxidoreductase [Gordonia zhaorongruii]|uniref:PPOX class F420-dependent oxidoreductase n=1 Tax=Gordonia zhaorongruii TaxID=2597659 RepID=UPI001053EDD0|nr:PPOX class F420-dependent oxidoreductase [Gordonia zhaorongruii]